MMRKECQIIRCSQRVGDPQVGLFLFEGRPELITLELPKNLNIQDISCIPEGKYVCRRRKSEIVLGETFQVMNVPERTAILFHPGNSIADTKGCILLGSEIGFVNGNYGIMESKKAFNKFMSLLKGENEFDLIISQIG